MTASAWNTILTAPVADRPSLHPPTISGYVLDDDDWYIRPLREGELLPTFFYRGFVNDGKVYLHDPEFDPDPALKGLKFGEPK